MLPKPESQFPQFAGAFTINEAAAYLRISRAGVYRFINEGKLKRTRVGGRVLIRRADARAFLDSCVES